MKSLAVLVLIIFLIDIVAGPMAIALTWPKLVNAISAQSKNISMILTVFRRLVHSFLVTIGFFIGAWLTYIAVTPAKLFGFFSIVTSYIALRREYFPDFYILRSLFALLGISTLAIPGITRKKLPPVFSADGTEITRSKKVRQIGRSTGRDGHGPGGQH